MSKKQILLGFLLGIIISFLFTLFIYYSNNPGLSDAAYRKFFIDAKLIVPIVSISLLANFVLFFIFIKLNKDEISKGILIATILIGLIVLILKFA